LQTLDSVELLDMVMKLTKIILTMPATNAISERSFSALRRMKTWLRSTMNQTRLNWCMVLHIHNDEFVSRNSTRSHIFGRLCKIFLLSFTVSTCLKMRFRHPKISKFSGGACPRTPLACQVLRSQQGCLWHAAKLAPPNQKSCLRPC